MIRIATLSALMTLVATPALGEKGISPALAESRLNGCLLAGSTATPHADLPTAVAAVRTFCAPQIKRVTADRVGGAAAGLSGEAREEAEDRAIRQLNGEIRSDHADHYRSPRHRSRQADPQGPLAHRCRGRGACDHGPQWRGQVDAVLRARRATGV
jgi:hypothetical protein